MSPPAAPLPAVLRGLVDRCLAAEADSPPDDLPPLDAESALALAWALKTECHKVWNSAPAQTARAARWLARLAAPAQGTADPQIQALADWTAGLAALVGGEMALALQCLEAASARFDQIALPLYAAQAGVPQLIALSMLGRHTEAIERATRVRERLAGAGDLHAACKVDLNRGSMLLRLDRYEEAGQSYRQAAVGFARAGDIEHSVMADIGMAATLSWQYKFGEAGRMLARARQRAHAHALPVLEGLACGELGQLALLRGERSGALRDFEAARRLLAGRAHPQRLIEADRALADAYLGVRLLPEARKLYAEVIIAALALDAPVEAAWASLQLAQTLLLLDQPEAADAALSDAQAGFATLGNTIGQARAELLAARRSLARQQPLAALQAALLAARTLGEAHAIGWRIEAECVAAQALAALGRTDEAATLLARLSLDAEKAGALPQRPWCELARAELAEQCGDEDAARWHYQRAAALFEHMRTLLPPGELRIASALDAEKAGDALVRLAAPAGDAGALLQCMEHARARSLHDHWQLDGPTGADMRRTPRTAPPQDSLRARLNWLYLQWQQSLLAGPGQAARTADLLAQVRQAETAWQAWLRQEMLQAAPAPALTGPEPSANANPASGPTPGPLDVPVQPALQRRTQSVPEPSPAGARPTETLDIAALQQALGPQRALLAYHLDGEQWRACLVRQAGVQTCEGTLPKLAARLQQLRFQLGAMRQPGSAHQRHAPQLLARTRQLLIGLHADLLPPALEEALDDVTQLVIVPHRGLHALPWAALVHEQRGSLLDRFELVTSPSATTWLHCHRRSAASAHTDGTTLVMGAGGASLPAIAQEVAAVGQALGEGCQMLTGEQASTVNFFAHAPQAQTLHLACHASCRADNPDFSALHFNDGVLTLADASHLRLRAGLVTLSACDTAVSRVAPGDEVLGLARGFLLAGAHAVIASLWSVEDGSTAALMASFYQGRRLGLGAAAALRRAQQTLAREQPHPFFWAAFVVHGHG